MVREEAVKRSTGLIPLIGKALGKTVNTIVGLDVTTMGDATIDGHRRRASDAIRAEYDELAIRFKRDEVKAAVRGEAYQPNFLMGLTNIRKVTDGMQDFTPKREDSSFVYRPSFDTSQEQPIGIPGQMPFADEKKAKVSKMSKVTMNYDIRKEKTPIA
jgi:hypothetical protein